MANNKKSHKRVTRILFLSDYTKSLIQRMTWTYVQKFFENWK